MSTQIVRTRPDLEVIEKSIAAYRHQAAMIQVRNADEYALAIGLYKTVKADMKTVEMVCDPFIEFQRQALDKSRAEKRKYYDPLSEIAETVSRKAEAWRAEEKRKAEQEQRRLQEQARIEAERKAQEERRAAEAEADRQRKERQKEIAEAQKAGELNKREAERLKKQAEEDAVRAKEQAAREAEATGNNVPPIEVQPAIPKIVGIRARVNWKFKLVDEMQIPRSFLQPNEVAIGSMVRLTKNKKIAEANCPGIEVWSEDSV